MKFIQWGRRPYARLSVTETYIEFRSPFRRTGYAIHTDEWLPGHYAWQACWYRPRGAFSFRFGRMFRPCP